MGARITRRLRSALAQRIVQQFPAFAGHAGRSLHRAAKAVQLARDVIQGRFELPPELTALLGEKQVARGTANHSAYNGCDDSFVLHVRLLRKRPLAYTR
jgi:hypothetical protein